MLKLAGAVAAVAFLWQSASVAHVSTVTYDLTLTATSADTTPISTYDGNGSFTLSSAPSTTLNAVSNYNNVLVKFQVDGEQFSGTASVVQFTSGTLDDITFAEQIGVDPIRFSLATTSGYVFTYDNLSDRAFGTIEATLDTTPLPASLPLFATALAGLGLLVWYRKRAAIAA